MNRSEKLMNERMNFRSHRGRSAAWQRENWLKNLRAERKQDNSSVILVVNGWLEYHPQTIRQAKIEGLSIINQLRAMPHHKRDILTAEVYDKNTMIKLWEAER